MSIDIRHVPFDILKPGDLVHTRNLPEQKGIIYSVDPNKETVGIYWWSTEVKKVQHISQWDACNYAEPLEVTNFDWKKLEETIQSHLDNSSNSRPLIDAQDVMDLIQKCKEYDF